MSQGGRGELTWELSVLRGVRSTVVDPRPTKLNKAQHRELKDMAAKVPAVNKHCTSKAPQKHPLTYVTLGAMELSNCISLRLPDPTSLAQGIESVPSSGGDMVPLSPILAECLAVRVATQVPLARP